MTSFYDRYVLPRFIGCACGAGIIAKQRSRIVPRAEGRVLELGIGGGLNLAFYDPAKVTSVTGIDPSEGLRDVAMAAPRSPDLKVEILAGTAETLGFEDHSFDTVVCTFTLCSVQAPAEVLAQARRVLKPGGRFLFCEHGLAPDPKVARWQRGLEPFWTPLAGGCHLTRPVGATITAAGFTIDEGQAFYMPKTPRSLGWCELGVARLA